MQACAIPQTAGYGGRLITVPPNDSCMPLTIVFAGGMTIAILGELPVTVAQAGTLSASATGSFDDPQILEIADDPSRDSVNEDACLLRSSLLMERFCGTIPTSQHTNDDRLPAKCRRRPARRIRPVPCYPHGTSSGIKAPRLRHARRRSGAEGYRPALHRTERHPWGGNGKFHPRPRENPLTVRFNRDSLKD